LEIEVDNEYIMSPKDLKTIGFLNKLLDSGVSVLKIEGRARSPEYVYTVVECYREAVQAYFEDTFTNEKIADWDERLASVFNRGFWDGYYLGQNRTTKGCRRNIHYRTNNRFGKNYGN
jgi:putative protease